MCPALTDEDALNGCPAFPAAFPLPLVNAKVILELPASVDPVDTGTVTADPLLEYGADGKQ